MRKASWHQGERVEAGGRTDGGDLNPNSFVYLLAQHFRWAHNLIVPNVYFPFVPFEADMIVVSKAGYLTEVEVKHSLADWKRDATKARAEYWQMDWATGERTLIKPLTKHELIATSGIHRRFYFAVPNDLAEKHTCLSAAELPEWAGILAFGDGRIRKIRPCRMFSARKITDGERARLMRPFYYRFWRAAYGGDTELKDTEAAELTGANA